MTRSVRSTFRSGGRVAVMAIAFAGCLASPATAAVPDELTSLRSVQSVDRASYTVTPRTGRPRTRFVATVRNEGTSTIELGRPFAIARRTADGWKRLSHGRRCAWTMEAYILRPGGSFSQRVGRLGSDCMFRKLQPGSYRVIKWIRFTDEFSPARDKVVRAPFEVR